MNNKGFISVGVVLLVVLLIGIFGFFSLYNGLKEAEIRVDASYGQVENQMQRRSDLIPNLVNTVKGYDVHEKSIIEEVGLYNKCCGDTNCIFAAFIFLPEKR